MSGKYMRIFQDRGLYIPWSNGTEQMDYIDPWNCGRCKKSEPQNGPGACLLAAAIARGELTRAEVEDIGGVVLVEGKDGWKSEHLADCRHFVLIDEIPEPRPDRWKDCKVIIPPRRELR